MINGEDKSESNKFFDPSQYNTAFIGGENTKSEGKVSNLISLLTSTENREFKNDALKIIKEKKGLDVLMSAISRTKKNKHVLIAACWEADIDASEHLDFFLNIALKEDYLSTLEAITVIENMEGSFSTEQIKKAIAEVRMVNTSESSDKHPLLVDLISILEAKLPS